MWTLPARDLAVLLHQLIEHGDGNARYYADMSQAVVFMAVMAPPGPPRTAARFLDRLDPAWLQAALVERRTGCLRFDLFATLTGPTGSLDKAA